jgi:CDP-6-deoxy-D-xylo-4-hexulose-3-dehydrase
MKLDWPLMKNNIAREDLDAVINHLKLEDPILTHSKNVAAFESDWNRWLGTRHSVMVNSGASANLLTMAALRELRGPGEVIVPPLTWVSDIASVMQCGHTPVFVDIDRRSLAMDTDQVLKAITPRTKAVFLTHILGYNGLTERLVDDLARRNVPLIEDACESHGATFNGRKVGSIGWVSNFSFYYAHHMSTIEGGMISTDDPDWYQLIRMLRSHGMVRELAGGIGGGASVPASASGAGGASVPASKAGSSGASPHRTAVPDARQRYYDEFPDLNPDFIFAVPGYNVRPTEIGGILGRSQLKRLDANNAIRSENLGLFLSQLDPVKYQTDFAVEGSCNYAFTLVLNKPDAGLWNKVELALRSNGVEFRRGLSGGGNQLRQPYLRRVFGNLYEKFPVTDHVHFYGCYIGNYPTLEKDKIALLCDLLNRL